MKSDTDFANPYEKELYAQESKIKALEAKNAELEKNLEEMTIRKDQALGVYETCEAVYKELEKKLVEAELAIKQMTSCYKVTNKNLKIAIEALEFYGDKENWQAPEDQGFEHHDTLDNTLADMIHEDHDKKTGGKRARMALEKIKGTK